MRTHIEQSKSKSRRGWTMSSSILHYISRACPRSYGYELEAHAACSMDTMIVANAMEVPP